MSQWLGSLQIHDFNQTATRLKEQQQQPTSSAVAMNDTQAGDKGPTTVADVATSTVAGSEQPLNVTSDVSCQQTGEKTAMQSNLELEVHAPSPIADASSDHEQSAKVQSSKSSLEESDKISDTIDTVEHTNEMDKNDTDMEQIASENNKDRLQTKS